MNKDVVHIYNGIIISLKKEWNNAICSKMDEPGDYHIKWTKTGRERQILYNIAYIQNLKKMIQTNLFYKTEIDSKT